MTDAFLAMEGLSTDGATLARPQTAAERFGVIPMPDLTFTPEVARETEHLYQKVRDFIPAFEWPVYAPYVAAINRLKRERNAVILAHNYQTPEIFHCVADIVGDSLQLARDATRVDAEIIVQCGVHFMAETSKLLNPQKTVLIPDSRAGCSLSESITGADVRLLKQRYPGVPVVTYVNTSADVKAETDICCTSSNVLAIVESLESDTVLCIPDEYLAMNVAKQTNKNILTWKGHCEVHERFTAGELLAYKAAHPGIEIIGHPECHPDVIAVCDFAGSTAGMINYVKDKRPPKVLLVTECSMASNIQAEVEGVEFIKPCNLCPHMKRITLPKILDSLLTMTDEVLIDPEIADRARLAVERMINLKQ
ncbi:quinolinate synthetase [Rhizobium sp. PP-F2F-G38]|nr:quinolinate synthetase [Rhizobium sp. PP-WC-1G-195]PYE99380.1 quinolinate synthetase [Rhizobium sp. PP-F2F-G38]